MKKLMLTLLAILGLVAMDASAGFRNCYKKRGCEKACVERVCDPCQESCKVDRIIEAPCPDVPCCVRYVKVEEPATITKHISYSWDCPSGCTPEQKAAGMMEAGASGTFTSQSAKGGY